MSYPFVLQLIIHMFHASLIPCISLDQYLNPNLYTIPNMQNMRFFCCSVYIRVAPPPPPPKPTDGSFEHQKHMFRLMDKKLITILRLKIANVWLLVDR